MGAFYTAGMYHIQISANVERPKRKMPWSSAALAMGGVAVAMGGGSILAAWCLERSTHAMSTTGTNFGGPLVLLLCVGIFMLSVLLAMCGIVFSILAFRRNRSDVKALLALALNMVPIALWAICVVPSIIRIFW